MSIRRVERLGDHVLYLGDMEEVLPALGRFDAVVTDPPYGIGESSKKAMSREAKGIPPRDYGEFDWDKEPLSAENLALICAVSRYQIIWGGNYFPVPPSSCWLVWDKENSGDFADCELAWTNLKKAVRLKRHMWNGMLRKHQEERFHPTQKPIDVMTWCLQQLPDGVSSVLDPFMGSGTTGIACCRMGMRFTGVERDERYFDIACERISRELSAPSLF